MPLSDPSDAAPFTLLCLHYLGGSSQSWSAVIQRLAGHMRCIALDLPGFGSAADRPGESVAEMADSIGVQVRNTVDGNWLIAGHSMGAKIAAVLARRAENGEEGLGGLRGVVSLSGSPPSPEPMREEQRQSMLSWFTGDPASWPQQAHDYITDNIGSPLPPPMMEQAVSDVLRMRPTAWAAWLSAGSREDWADRIGILRTPALILAGSEDTDLGEDAQRRFMAPHFAAHRLVTLHGAGHLLPLERPDDVASLIVAHAESLGHTP